MEEISDPGGAVFDVGHFQFRVALEELVGDEYGGEVVDQAAFHEHGDDCRGGGVTHAATVGRWRLAPLACDGPLDLDVAVLEAGVRGYDQSGFGYPGPEGVEYRVGRRFGAFGRVGRAVADRDDPCASPGAPFDLLDRLVEVRQGEERDGEDAVVVGEAPVVVEPAVEGPEDVDGRLGVGLHRAFHADALRREQPCRLDALLVHAAQPGVAVEPFGVLVGVLARQLVAQTGLVAPAGEVLVEGPGPGPHVHVAGAGQDRMDPVVVGEDVAGFAVAVEVDEPHASVRELGVAVAGEGLAGLPIVVVGVEDRRDLIVGVGHDAALLRFRRCRGGAGARASRWCIRRR